MAKVMLMILYVVVIGVGFLQTYCKGALYTVGGTAGWDISSDFDSWLQNKTFLVGDTLMFQYSSYHSVSELSKESFNGCNLTNPISSSSNGNTTIPLSTPGDRYFVCGNKLHCLGGMKLHVITVNANNQASSPATTPVTSDEPPAAGAPTYSLPHPSAKNNNSPSSSGFVHGRSNSGLLVSLVALLLCVC